MRLFWNFPYWDAGFSGREWGEMTRNDRVIVKDWYLNQRNQQNTAYYAEYETDFQVKKVSEKYDLESRPCINIQWSDFNLVG